MYDVPVPVKEALRDGRLKKNIRFVVLNDDGTEDFTIDNDNLVSESVSIDERMCSGETLKFGLCEGSSLEFQYFEKENITGRRLQMYIDAYYDASPETIGTITKGVNYTVTIGGKYKIYVASASASLANMVARIRPLNTMYYTLQLYPDGHKEVEFDCLSGDLLQLQGSNGATGSIICTPFYYPIPMGFFDVKNCSRQASTGIIKVTAYNKLQSDYLDEKANNRILQTFGFDATMTVHDIRDLLLDSYQIEEDVSVLATPHREPGEIVVEESIYSDLGAFRFSQLYGVKSPINAYRAGVSSISTDFHIWIVSQHPDYEYDSPYIKFDAYTGTLEGLEANIVAYIKKVINDAQLNRSGDDAINYICQNIGFQKIFSIQPQGYNKPFSTVQWEYEEAHNLPHTVMGPITDKRVQLLNGAAKFTLPDTINLDGAEGISFWFSGDVQNVGSLTYSTNYQYYLDSSMTRIGLEPCPYATFSDGTQYFESNNTYDAIVGWDYSGLPTLDKISFDPVNVEEFTLRDIISAVYESIAQFGQLNRITDLFSGVELNHSRLYPSDNLYPADTLYPYGAAASATKSMYSKLWADEGNVHKWKYLIITYKTLNENNEEVETKLQRTINNDGTDNYNMSDNWLMRNLIWTAEDVGALADSMVAKMQDITWFPFEMWCAGLPYLETGDEIEIPLGEHSYTSYILQRQLKGIQNLQDTYINGTLDIF